ncbi:hypothetical protein Tco_0763109 [Tanacetum coccineum]
MLHGKGPNWLFDLDYLTDSMNYPPVRSENQANKTASPKEANHSTDDDIWKNKEKWIIKKRRYPLIRETLERMMELRLTTKSEDIKNWLVQKQTAFGKDFSNLFTADSLLKTIWFSTHHASHAPCYSNEALAIPEQTATGKEISNPFMVGSLPKTT